MLDRVLCVERYDIHVIGILQTYIDARKMPFALVMDAVVKVRFWPDFTILEFSLMNINIRDAVFRR